MDYKILFSQTKDLSLLLVEDYEPLRNDMEEMLTDLFKTVTVASDGREALKIYKEYYASNDKGFDLLITDIQMPLMNGVELSEAVRDIRADQQIIVLSAYTDSNYLLRLINLGIAQFITKPIDQEELMNALCKVSKNINTIEVDPQNIIVVEMRENYTWDKEKLVLKQNNKSVELTRYELLLMQLFVQKVEQVCTNDDIMQIFYDNSIDINEKSIRNLVFKLRKKLPDSTINSMYGLGYKFTPLF